MTPQHRAAIDLAIDAIVDAVKEGGSMGVPGGVLYSALLDKITLTQFQALMACAVAVGRLTKRGELYFAVAS